MAMRFLHPSLAATVLAVTLTIPAFAAPRPVADPGPSVRARVAEAPADVRPALTRLYENAGVPLLWFDRGKPSTAGRQLADRLADAGQFGLDPETFDGPALQRRAKEYAKRAPTAEGAADFDVALSSAALRLVTTLACGRLDAKTLGASAEPKCPEADPTVLALRDARGQDAAFAAVEPTIPAYVQLRKGLARYRAMVRDSALVPLPEIPKDLQPGQPLAAAPALRRLLKATGDLPAKGKSPKPSKDLVYAPELVAGVKRFQARHGQLPDGILWTQTIERLNRPFRESVRQIELSLERWRSLRPTFESPPVIVNVAAFRLTAYRDRPELDPDPLSMDVLVGAAQKHETPQFTAPMTHVIFRPNWEVPADIANFELGPRALTDRENMERLGYVLVRGSGEKAVELPLTPENVARLGKDLRMRQKPGEANALGLVKFMLPNGDDIYLHDTSAQGLFVMPRRDFSHGCVRVAEPVALAELVLRDEPGWTIDKVKEAMHSGADNFRVDLKNPIPVLITYSTAVANDDGEVSFYADIYGEDAKLEKLLEADGGRAKRTAQGRISTRVPTGITR
jgi:murein L,D-transpeptidase YcbB/YkuD